MFFGALSFPNSNPQFGRVAALLQLEDVFNHCAASFLFSLSSLPCLSLSSSHEMVKAECGICAICSFKEMAEASSKLFIAILAMRMFPSETHSVSL